MSDADDARTPLAVYVHWPFCKAVCPYCDFNVRPARPIDDARWTRAFVADLTRAADVRRDGPVDTVSFGGGTPSLMSPRMIAVLLERIDRLWGLRPGAEVTLEANPTSASADRLTDFAAAGITRLSLGVQSLRDPALVFLGRTHDVAAARASYDRARATFDHVSLDVIYARPGQHTEDWVRELGDVLDLRPTHLSAYQLTVDADADTPFARRRATGRLVLPEESDALRLLETTREMCEAAGLPAYETSNHARPGHACRHNMLIWRGADYVGVGPGAHGRIGRDDGRRLATRGIADPFAWIDVIERTGCGWADASPLSVRDVGVETLLLGLRLSDGIPLAQLDARGVRTDPRTTYDLRQAGFLEPRTDALVPTRRGRAVVDRLAEELSP